METLANPLETRIKANLIFPPALRPASTPDVSLNMKMSVQSKQGTFRLSHGVPRLALCSFPADCSSRLFKCDGPVENGSPQTLSYHTSQGLTTGRTPYVFVVNNC